MTGFSRRNRYRAQLGYDRLVEYHKVPLFFPNRNSPTLTRSISRVSSSVGRQGRLPDPLRDHNSCRRVGNRRRTGERRANQKRERTKVRRVATKVEKTTGMRQQVTSCPLPTTPEIGTFRTGTLGRDKGGRGRFRRSVVTQ